MPKILIVEDDPIEATNLRILLEARGDEFVLRPTGDGLNDEIKRFQPDVIVLDVVLPGDDGYALCRKIKADDQIRSIPVIFASSARRANNDAQWGRRSGGVAYLCKPISARELDFAVELALGTRKL